MAVHFFILLASLGVSYGSSAKADNCVSAYGEAEDFYLDELTTRRLITSYVQYNHGCF